MNTVLSHKQKFTGKQKFIGILHDDGGRFSG